MTETEWLACANPLRMLEFLRAKSSDRKLRLFAVACCRRLFDTYGYAPCWEEPLTWAEWYADGKATSLDLTEIEQEVQSDACEPCDSYSAVAEAVASAVATRNFDPSLVPGAVIRAANCCAYLESIREENEEFASQCDLLRDLFGPLLFRPVVIAPAWLTPGVIEVAHNIYDKRSFDRLPALAKELREAGCAEAIILAHCRKKDAHVRGCWLIDLLLGRE
jgi:hypothetical protein